MVVVGGGIVGCAAAYFLARSGTQVVLVDKGDIAFEQSSRNWGWVRQNGRDLRELPMAMLSRTLWAALEEELSVDVGWASEGNLHLGYTTQEMETFEEWRKEAAQIGLETHVVDRQGVDDLFPGLDDETIGGIFSPLDGQADPHRAAPALAEAAAASGASLYPGCAVVGIEVEAGRVRAVDTEGGRIRTSTVILAAGAWSSRLLWTLGVRLPQRKMRATVSATVPGAALSRRAVWAKGLALRQDHEGSFVLACGGGRVPLDLETMRFRHLFKGSDLDTDRRGEIRLRAGLEAVRDLGSLVPGLGRRLWGAVRAEEPMPDERSVEGALDRFHSLLPSQAAARTGRRWAGNIDYTPDAAPVIERLDEPGGLVVATGFSGHGFALGPAGGLLASELALEEHTSVDTHPFRLARFADGAASERRLHF